MRSGLGFRRKETEIKDKIEIDFSSATSEGWIADDIALKYDESSENYRDASVQRQQQKTYKILVKDGGAWRDGNGVEWKSTLAYHRFVKARCFAPGSDEKILLLFVVDAP